MRLRRPIVVIVISLPRRPLQTVPGVATSKGTSPSVVEFFVGLG